MNTSPDLQVRLCIREALNRINEASGASSDPRIVARLKYVTQDLEDILANLAPDPQPLYPGKCDYVSSRRSASA